MLSPQHQKKKKVSPQQLCIFTHFAILTFFLHQKKELLFFFIKKG